MPTMPPDHILHHRTLELLESLRRLPTPDSRRAPLTLTIAGMPVRLDPTMPRDAVRLERATTPDLSQND